jgi:hypothetical protein
VSRFDWSRSTDLSNTLGNESEGFADLEDGVRHDGVGTSLRRSGCRDVDCSLRKPSITSSASVRRSDDFSHLPPHHRYRSSTTMDLRNSFLKPFKKAKQKLTGSRHKRDAGSEGETDRGGKEADAGRSEVNQRNSRLNSEAEDVVGSEPIPEGSDIGGDEVGRVGSPPPTSSISYNMEPNSM